MHDLQPSQVNKRAVVINHHKTSISLELPFWQYIKRMAERSEVSISKLLSTIDGERKQENLSSCLRLIALQDCQARIGELEAELASIKGSADFAIHEHVAHVG